MNSIKLHKIRMGDKDMMVTPREKIVDDQLNREKADSMYKRFERAETGSVANMFYNDDGEYWRRTKAPETKSGSTAFGPVQITGRLFKDVKNRKKQFGITPDEEEALDGFINQSKMFAKHGKNKGKQGYDKRFDYASRGVFNEEMQAPEDREYMKSAYKSIAKKIMMKNLADSGGDEQKAIERWRGVPIDKDPDYWNRYNREK